MGVICSKPEDVIIERINDNNSVQYRNEPIELNQTIRFGVRDLLNFRRNKFENNIT